MLGVLILVLMDNQNTSFAAIAVNAQRVLILVLMDNQNTLLSIITTMATTSVLILVLMDNQNTVIKFKLFRLMMS